MEALMLAIEGKWNDIKPTGYMSRRLEDLYDGLVNTFDVDEQFLANIPKQVNKKPVQNPKFKVGDWVVKKNRERFINNSKFVQITKIEKDKERYWFDCDTWLNAEDIELWTIQDAKDGDVLVDSERNVILMFRAIGNIKWDGVIDYHCYYYCSRKDFIVHKDSDYWGSAENTQLKPATKEQCDLLFSKMKEAGYEWNVETKVLNKIEQNPADKVGPHFHVEKGKWYVCIRLFTLNGNIVVSKGRTYKSLEDNAISGEDGRLFIDNHDGDVSKYFRPWTIRDANPGDVLASDNGNCPFIYRAKTVFGNPVAYCGVGSDGLFISESPEDHQWCLKDEVTPTTKEQRDILFQKMKEAGYEWDAETNKIKQAPDELAKSEDEKIRKAIIEFFELQDDNTTYSFVPKKDILSWLEKQGTARQLYVRFGDIPDDEKSKIYGGDEGEIGVEAGVSVYPAFEVDGNIILGLTLPITQTTLHTQQHLLEYDDRPCYLVSGDYVGKGADGEPLIRNVSVIKQVDNYRIKEPVDKPEPKSKKRNG